jgi:hypothetical protein
MYNNNDRDPPYCCPSASESASEHVRRVRLAHGVLEMRRPAMCRAVTGQVDVHETAWLVRPRVTAAVFHPITSWKHRPSTKPGSFRLVATTRIKLPAHLPHSNNININTPIVSPFSPPPRAISRFCRAFFASCRRPPALRVSRARPPKASPLHYTTAPGASALYTQASALNPRVPLATPTQPWRTSHKAVN